MDDPRGEHRRQPLHRLRATDADSSADELDRGQIDEDVKSLTAYYRSFGYFLARVDRKLEFDEKQNSLKITFAIDEGPRYFVRNVLD